MNNDLISRSALKDYARTVLCEDNATNYSLLKMFDEIIDNAPTVEERPQGEWIDIDSLVSKARCSKCKNIMLTEPFGKTDFCPNCGAKMKKSQTQKFADNDAAYSGLASAT